MTWNNQQLTSAVKALQASVVQLTSDVTALKAAPVPKDWTSDINAIKASLAALTIQVNELVIPADQSAAIAGIQATLVQLQKEIDNIVQTPAPPPPPPPPPPPATVDFIDVTDHNSAILTGTGATVARVRWPEGGPYWGYIKGPYVASQGVFFTNTNDLQVLTLIGCAALAINFDLSNPDGILISTANPVASPTPPPPNPTGAPPPPVVLPNIMSSQTGAPPSPTGMRAEWNNNGITTVFNEVDGTDIGDYTNPLTGKSHKNIKVRGPNRQSVIFRPENDGTRFEVEFGYGNIFEPIQPDLGPSTVNIYNNDVPIGTFSEAKHIWITNSFWESAPRPIVKNAAQLVSEKWVLPLDASACDFGRPADAPAYTPMGISDITGYMPQTGARPDIGLHPQRTSCFIAAQDASLIPSIMAWGWSAYSIPTDTTDPFRTDGAVLNFNNYPADQYGVTVNFSDNKSYGRPPTLGFTMNGVSNGIYFDGGSHLPELPFVPFALTGDIKPLLAAQRMMTMLLSQDGYRGGILRFDNTRIYAWGLRELFNMCRMMRDMGPQPAFLLPYSYWKAALDANRKWFTDSFVNNPSPLCSVLRLSTQFAGQAFWQIDYLISVLGEGVYQGFTEWMPAFEWQLGNAIARTNGTSGWPRTVFVYYAGLYRQYDANGVGFDAVATWGELAVLNGVVDTGTGLLSSTNDPHYEALTRESLRIGQLLGVDVSTSFDFLDPQVRARTNAIDWQESY